MDEEEYFALRKQYDRHSLRSPFEFEWDVPMVVAFLIGALLILLMAFVVAYDIIELIDFEGDVLENIKEIALIFCSVKEECAPKVAPKPPKKISPVVTPKDTSISVMISTQFSPSDMKQSTKRGGESPVSPVVTTGKMMSKEKLTSKERAKSKERMKSKEKTKSKEKGKSKERLLSIERVRSTEQSAKSPRSSASKKDKQNKRQSPIQSPTPLETDKKNSGSPITPEPYDPYKVRLPRAARGHKVELLDEMEKILDESDDDGQKRGSAKTQDKTKTSAKGEGEKSQKDSQPKPKAEPTPPPPKVSPQEIPEKAPSPPKEDKQIAEHAPEEKDAPAPAPVPNDPKVEKAVE